MSTAAMDGGKPGGKAAGAGKKAWQGPNPITAKSSPSSLPNGDKPLPKLPMQAQQGRVDRHAHDRLSYLLTQMVGHDAVLTLKNGEQFIGVFSGCFVDAQPHQYILKMVRRTRSPTQQQTNGAADTPDEYIGEGSDHTMTFDVQDTVDLNINDLAPVAAVPSQNGKCACVYQCDEADDACSGSMSSSFRTDTEISAQRDTSMPRERELQRWDASTADTSIDMSLELEYGGSSNWDQFATNERMYGVQTDYDESIYTTSIDRTNPRYKQLEAEAARIAKEIESSATTDAHVAEERGVKSDRDDGLDEEDKYSGVRRDAAAPLPKRTAGAYVPPSQRPITGAPTVSGAPFDPAIISSQLAKPTPPPSKVTAADQTSQAEAPSIERREPSVTEAGQSSRAPSQQPQKRSAEQTTEDHMRNVADAFKQFSSNEKFRVKQAQEAKRANARQEKNVRLNDLKRFAESFKLHSRVPDDLVPILAKDRDKQKEIQHKAEEAAREAELKAEERKKSGSSLTSPSLSSTANGHIDSVAGTMGAEQRVAAFNQHNRQKAQQHRPVMQTQTQTQTQTPRGPTQNRIQQGGPAFPRNGAPVPNDIRIPTGPAASLPNADRVPLSPSSATSARLNVNAFEFRPAASTFTPAGASPSPQRSAAVTEQHKASATDSRYFSKERKALSAEGNDLAIIFNPVRRMMDDKYADEHKKAIAANGGIPKPWFTTPTWPTSKQNVSMSYKDSYPKPPAASSSQGPSPLHTPNPVGVSGPMPHSHQLPHHLHAPSQMGTPNHRPPFYTPANPHGQPPFAPPIPQFGPNGSVQNSPRFPQAQIAFNQMPPHMTSMGPFPGQPMPPYGISPTLAYRQPQIPMAMGGGVVMAPQPQGQSKFTYLKRQNDGGRTTDTNHLTVPHMRPTFPQGPQMMPQMGTQVMMPSPAGGGYMNGPGMPQQGYSPMPMHAQPTGNFSHMQPGHGTPAGYSASPRPPMMQHSGSHQGFQPQMSGHMPGPPFAPNQGGPQHMHYQRQMSGQGFPHMTPRQQHAQVAPAHPSPGVGQGDEGK